MKIVVLDGHTVNPGDNPWDELAAFGTLAVFDRSAPDQVVARAGEAEIVLANKTLLPAETLAQLPRLRLIVELATGFDNIDVAFAGRHGIPVANVPVYGAASVAQHTFALILELCNRVGEHDRAVKTGAWIKAPDFSFTTAPLVELAGRRLGIVGFGEIGRRVAAIAHAFGMKVLAYNPRPKEALSGVPVTWTSLEELFAAADIVSLHCPLTAENRGFVARPLLKTMKRDAFLINTARGALVNERDLAAALGEGQLAGAAVDVVDGEPMLPANPLLAVPSCIITPHIAWASLAARRRLLAGAVGNVAAFLAGAPSNVVNRQYLSGSRAL